MVNQTWASSFFDGLLPHIADLKILIGVLIIFLGAVAYFRRLEALNCVTALIFAVVLTHFLSHKIIPKYAHRDRPQFSGIPNVQLKAPSLDTPCFPSPLSADAFAAATVFTFSVPALGLVAFPFAMILSYSRIYVGLHFPLDTVAGALIGLLIGLILSLIFKIKRPKWKSIKVPENPYDLREQAFKNKAYNIDA